jgi:hypothetical protein
MADDTGTTTTMTGTAATTDTGTTTGTTGGGDTTVTEPPEEAGLPEGVKKALAAARKDAREAERARKALEAEVNGYKERDLTEQQKLEQRATAAERAAQDANRELLRIKVARATDGLTADDADLITGDTEEEMTARAVKLAERLGGGATNFDGGPRTTTSAPQDMNALIRAARNR